MVGGRHFYSLWGLLSFEDGLYDDDNGHGTHCAGIAAAKNNDFGVVGIAPGARLWAVKVLDSAGSGYLSDVIAGLDWVTAHASTIEVANMSLTATGSSSIFRTAIQNSVASGIVCVVAAGNDAKDVYGFDGVFGTSDDVIPAAYPEAATISAMVDSDGLPSGLGDSTGYGSDDSFANFSNDSHSVVAGNPVTSPGKAIDLLMPGVNIYSCYMNGGYATGSGTSMASPHAAGLAAFYIAINGRATSASGVYAIRQALIDAGVAQTDPRGLALQNDFDGNKENIGWAGSEEPPPPVDESPTVTITSPEDGAGVSGQVTVTAVASDDVGVIQVEFFVDGGSIGLDVDGANGWSASWNTTLYSNDAHTVRVTATDTTAQTTSDAVETMVNNAQAPRIAQVNVLAKPLLSYRTWWVATAMVTVAEDNIAVAGATVEGVWSGLYKKAALNTTDFFGFISFETGWLRKAGTVTFTVTRVVAPDGQEYVLDPPEPWDSTTGP